MIVLGIVATCLALTVAGFAALSTLGRIELGKDEIHDPKLAVRDSHEPTLIETWPTMPGVSPL